MRFLSVLAGAGLCCALGGCMQMEIITPPGSGSSIQKEVRQFGGAGTNFWIDGLDFDSSDNSYISGQYSGGAPTVGSVTFPTATCGTAWHGEGFVARLDIDGNPVWAESFSPSGTNCVETEGLRTDSSGNLYIAGGFLGTLDMRGHSFTSAGGEDIFLVKFDSNGNYLWCETFGGTGTDWASYVHVDSGGDVYITGKSSAGNFTVGSTTLASYTATQAFLMKFSGTDGSPIWVKQLVGSGSDQEALAVFTDSSDNVVITGYYETSLDLGGGARACSASNSCVFLAKYDSSGTYLWDQTYQGGSGGAYDEGLTIDANDNIYFTAESGTSLVLGGSTVTGYGGSGQADTFLVKASGTDGSLIWYKHFGSAGSGQWGSSVTTSPDGSVFFVKNIYGSMDFGGGTVTLGSGWDGAALVKYDTNGNYVWGQYSLSSTNGIWTGEDWNGEGFVRIRPDGALLFNGQFSGSTNVDGTSLTAIGTADEFFQITTQND